MPNQTEVGAAVAEALARAQHHRQRSPRKMRVRLLTQWGEGEGLTVQARIAGRCESELVAQEGLGVRVIPWAELDRRAGELPGLVDAAVEEIETAVAAAPAPARPSRVEGGLDWEAYEGLAEAAYERVLAVMRPLVEEAPDSLSLGGALEAVFLGLMKAAALASVGAGMGKDDAREMLEAAVAELLGRVSEGHRASLAPRLDA
ncbi:MAG: hypothetical protein A2790_08670 [Phenylobacterium sp. RIFCSPHIGHO2_01_FULL_69_31]|uniref:hypothetical protein n=1 Tax=Phenylobacterium sp. RIFCSPHIGHO2_01_FULL_69_31 TaxID=1801944 RepID=UPI0008C7D7BD|nr:hypothetical protein [Phenylobacterium sp. RIFCSPHIGHO2_01_FULL_69_31]OHB28624.1 MAG: hypothetical protein A2790_08670 [Phenylobacterium sp. RIFCSPHIGHO2_01_FULL_69_31]